MALFSKEYLLKNKIDLLPDFCIKDIFLEMEKDSRYPIICEGFGVVEIINCNNECRIKLINNLEVSYELLITQNNA